MIDEQTRRSIETMCQCGMSLESLKACYPKVSAEDLEMVFRAVELEEKPDDGESMGLSCNCS